MNCDENCEASWKREVKEGSVVRWGAFGRVEVEGVCGEGGGTDEEVDGGGWESGKEDGGEEEEGRDGVSVVEGMEGGEDTEGSKTTAGDPDPDPEPKPEPELARPATPALRLCGIIRGVVVVGVSVDVEAEGF